MTALPAYSDVALLSLRLSTAYACMIVKIKSIMDSRLLVLSRREWDESESAYTQMDGNHDVHLFGVPQFASSSTRNGLINCETRLVPDSLPY